MNGEPTQRGKLDSPLPSKILVITDNEIDHIINWFHCTWGDILNSGGELDKEVSELIEKIEKLREE